MRQRAEYLKIRFEDDAGVKVDFIIDNRVPVYSGWHRRLFTAPVNAQRFCKTTPCSVSGECGDCINLESICAQFVETRISRPKGRIKVILAGENLGI